MKARFAGTLALLLSCAATTAHTQAAPQVAGDDQDRRTVGASLPDLLAMATFGLLAIPDQTPGISRSGADYQVRLPLKQVSVPPDAAIRAVVRPAGDGLWDVTSMLLPPVGTIETATLRAGSSATAFAIGKQSIHGRIDPTFARMSRFAASLDGIRLRTDQAARWSEQALDSYGITGTTVAAGAGRLRFAAQDEATGGRFATHAPNGTSAHGTVQTVSGQVSAEGLDRAKGTMMARAVRALLTGATPPAAAPGQGASGQGASAAKSPELAALLDAATGLLTGLEVEQKLTGIRFSAAQGNSFNIGRLGVNLTIRAAKDRLDGRAEIALDKLSLATAPPGAGPYIPQRVQIVSVMADVPPGRLVALLHAAIARNADPADVLAASGSLFGNKATRIGIESLKLDSGPMRLTGSIWLRPRPDGQAGFDIHLSATGMDDLIARAQTTPGLQQALPALLLAKGIGHPEGNAVVWDITLGGGPLVVNGIPLGQPPSLRR